MVPSIPVMSMQLLLSEAQREPRSLISTSVSVVLHAGVFIALALSGQQVVRAVSDLIEQTVQYLYPAPRDLGLQRPGLASESAFGASRTTGAKSPLLGDHANGKGLVGSVAHSGAVFAPDPSQADKLEPGVGDDAYSTVEVDSLAFIDPTSVAPEYPEALSERHVEGGARFRFVIDSTGLIDMSTVRVMTSTHKLFTKAVLDAMPRMKYRPARIGSSPVRLLVEQAFSFKIVKPQGHIS
jgi:TonB family protein